VVRNALRPYPAFATRGFVCAESPTRTQPITEASSTWEAPQRRKELLAATQELLETLMAGAAALDAKPTQKPWISRRDLLAP
jgi:hypothetical protein